MLRQGLTVLKVRRIKVQIHDMGPDVIRAATVHVVTGAVTGVGLAVLLVSDPDRIFDSS